jgi:integrase
MHISIFRRHLLSCPHKAKGRRYDRCGCPIWADARPLGRLQSLGTSDRTTALTISRDMELACGAAPVAVAGPVMIADARTMFLDSLRFQGLVKASILKHETLWRQALQFAAFEKIVYLAELDAAAIARFMKTWADGVPAWNKKPEGAIARGKKIERLRQFYKFAIGRKWVAVDPTRGVKRTKVKTIQTPPFTENEMTKILASADRRVLKARTPKMKANAMRVRALILLLRFSGLRIGDGVSCKIEWVKDGRVRLVTQKNHSHIDVELPAVVLRALATVPPMSALYWFWTGSSALKTAVTRYQLRLLEIFRGAGIIGGHAHRFRDTFAVAILERGEGLQAVADALGNTLEITERHYNPWSKMRQSRLDESVRAGWANDPLLAQLGAAELKESRPN